MTGLHAAPAHGACYDTSVRSLVLLVVFGAFAAACLPCHPVTTTPIALECDAGAAFNGELHFDSAPSFRSFLNDRCLLESSDEAIDAIVADVDFGVDAVFVARGARSSAGRCITARAAESVNVCDDGLRVVFDDVESGDLNCGGSWTVAFKLPRDEMRAALQN